MKSFLTFFKKRGVAHYPGETVMVASTELLGGCKRLASVNALTSENVHDVLTGLSICNNARFKEFFSQLARSNDLSNVDILPTIRKSDPPKIKIDKILEKAVIKCVWHVLQSQQVEHGQEGRMWRRSQGM